MRPEKLKYELNTKELVDLTSKIAEETFPASDSGDAWSMWAVAQRKSVPLKVEASISTSLNYYVSMLIAGSIPNVPGHGKVLLRECLLNVHKSIVNCWNFETGDDDPEILKSNEFRQMGLFIVQDINLEQGSQQVSSSGPDVGRINEFVALAAAASASIAPPAAIFGLSYVFFKWLTSTVLENIFA
ncbi:hypothetical protein M422DRAFT_56849 [Sphaerobolus stellatus SS14]|uniref:Uncharacterized protein n=1 Tax=Sphaerobolus stellatus (strain SS14) TaxID=990650 RepID=A0A0C9U2V3_SPHS4|nr:hypothetical protein M422DRAFT_56849 [Sphaerobolus stellatus SS14]